MTRYIVPSYVFSLENQDSLLTAKNFIATWNPIDSGKLFAPTDIWVSYTATSAGFVDTLRGYRISSQPTGGTLQPSSALCKLDTRHPDSVALIYTGNPSVGTLGAAFFSIPAAIVQETSGTQRISISPGADLLIRPGEGIVIRQEIGKPGHYWTIGFAWGSRAL